MSKFQVEAYAVVFQNGNFSLRASLQAAELLYSAEAHMAAREGSKTSPPIAIVRLGTSELIAVDEEVYNEMNNEDEQEEEDEEPEENTEEDEYETLCSACNGSGEGRYDGTRCIRCKGKGVASQEEID